MAPEILMNKGYDKTVDWWALGILLFEMLHGYTPFYDRNIYIMFEKIKSPKVPAVCGNFVSDEARDIISKVILINE